MTQPYQVDNRWTKLQVQIAITVGLGTMVYCCSAHLFLARPMTRGMQPAKEDNGVDRLSSAWIAIRKP
jgi:hypothetical protein